MNSHKFVLSASNKSINSVKRNLIEHLKSLDMSWAAFKALEEEIFVCKCRVELFTIYAKQFGKDMGLDAAIGRKIARENARDKIWALEGYLLKQRLADAG